ncbi:MAG: hypothetical protein U0800_19940 [Isosphaeraceae bacterium]
MTSSRPGALIPWSLLVPGLPQYLRGQGRRGAILAGWFGASMAVGLPTAGSWVGILLLGFAALVQVGSAADAIELAAFPRLAVGPRGRWSAAGLAVALGCYSPWVLLGSWAGWPSPVARGPLEFYLVQRSAYRTSNPRPGDRVWVEAHEGVEAGPAAVLAGPGEFIRRIDEAYLRPGLDPWRDPGFRPGRSVELEFRVPPGHLLVTFDPATPDGRPNRGPLLVPIARVAGRIGVEVPEFLRQAADSRRPQALADESEVPA